MLQKLLHAHTTGSLVAVPGATAGRQCGRGAGHCRLALHSCASYLRPTCALLKAVMSGLPFLLAVLSGLRATEMLAPFDCRLTSDLSRVRPCADLCPWAR